MALDYGCTGPMLRGSGVDHDLRRDGDERYTEPYDGYAFEVIVRAATATIPRTTTTRRCRSEAVLGDCWHRFYVRMLEVVQGDRARRQAIDRYRTATGNWGEPIKLTAKLPTGEAYLETECPARPDGLLRRRRRQHRSPARCGPAAARFCNLTVTHELCRGCLIADVPAIVGSLDIVMGEIDR